ncbi:signal peptidase I [Candidatus Berkelbacteria bacterium]|nr:signal peptidase I [Candidatus Berkelbacteria bacterium]
MKYFLAALFVLTKAAFLVFIFGVLAHYFVVTVFRISGESMLPNLEHGNFILVSRASYFWKEPQRFDVIGFAFPGDQKRQKFVKRIIGLPNEKVEIKEGKVFINQKELTENYLTNEKTEPDASFGLAKDEFFVLGDNRDNSYDSRFFGPLDKRFIIGKAATVIFPLDKLGFLIY